MRFSNSFTTFATEISSCLYSIEDESASIPENQAGTFIFLSMNKTIHKGNEPEIETAYILSQSDLVEAIRQGDEDVRNGNYKVVDIDNL